MEGRLERGAFPNKKDRHILALQLGERRRSSDAFALIPILSDPTIQTYLKEVAKYVLEGVVSYYTGKVLDNIKAQKDPNMQIFIGAIYTEVANITNRIGGAGEVEAVSLGSPALNRETIASFTEETKDYLSAIKNNYFLGKYTELKGEVYNHIAKEVAAQASRANISVRVPPCIVLNQFGR